MMEKIRAIRGCLEYLLVDVTEAELDSVSRLLDSAILELSQIIEIESAQTPDSSHLGTTEVLGHS